MNEKLTVKDIVFFVIVVLMAVGCIAVKIHENKQAVTASANKEKAIVGVHVKGEVNAPGYYELDYGKRIKDAIKSAGGETQNGDVNSVNLAERLHDGQEVLIPSKNKNEGAPVLDGKININTANEYELQTLSGIGEALSRDIVAYREAKGVYKNITDLKNVSGISSNKFNKIKDKIKVGD